MNNSFDWTIKDLEKWIKKIEKRVKEFNLDFFEQIFEICSYKDMIGYMSYVGMPSSYPHWSFGKAFEITETKYRYGIGGLPYEMVINSNPCLAYLMENNTLPIQLITIAHVYGHNDFFKNNINLSYTRPELVLGRIKTRADRIRSYIENPSIGPEKVENLLDIARALSMQRSHSLGSEQSSSDILLFIRDNNPFLEDWEKDILTIIDEEAQYFIPQRETKIMNEGWAVYWHYNIMKSLDLPDGVYQGFAVHHNRIVSPPPISVPFINPYHVGFKIWQDIRKRWDKKEGSGKGIERMFFSREVDRDASFLRQYLTKELMKELDIFQHEKIHRDRIITKISDKENWREIRELLIKNTGINSIPVIKVIDANYKKRQGLLIRHCHDGRDLLQEHTIRTMGHLQRLWKKAVFLETIENGQKVLYQCVKNKIKRMV